MVTGPDNTLQKILLSKPTLSDETITLGGARSASHFAAAPRDEECLADRPYQRHRVWAGGGAS
jgi:hypothetical protein